MIVMAIKNVRGLGFRFISTGYGLNGQANIRDHPPHFKGAETNWPINSSLWSERRVNLVKGCKDQSFFKNFQESP